MSGTQEDPVFFAAWVDTSEGHTWGSSLQQREGAYGCVFCTESGKWLCQTHRTSVRGLPCAARLDAFARLRQPQGTHWLHLECHLSLSWSAWVHHLSKTLGVRSMEQRCHFCSREGLPALDPDPVSMSKCWSCPVCEYPHGRWFGDGKVTWICIFSGGYPNTCLLPAFLPLPSNSLQNPQALGFAWYSSWLLESCGQHRECLCGGWGEHKCAF